MPRERIEGLSIDLGNGKTRIGGPALAQVYGEIGADSPDIEDSKRMNAAVEVTQMLIEREKILTGHGRSDGGLATTLLKVAFAGTGSIDVKLPPSSSSALEISSNEEAGFVIEYAVEDVPLIVGVSESTGVPIHDIGLSMQATVYQSAWTTDSLVPWAP